MQMQRTIKRGELKKRVEEMKISEKKKKFNEMELFLEKKRKENAKDKKND